ncbi:MAG: SLBB domain-containing protein [Solirubrobacterales bacterium]|nr:SLBB domain-containing protein [Solirubrobacterales bacterium]
MSLAEHERLHGSLPAPAPGELVEALELSGLRGRGGADFPTAQKLRAVLDRGGRGALIVNGNETEPASAKDRLLLSRLPHLVLDGALLSANAINAREVIVTLPESSVSAHSALEEAIAERGREASRVRLVAFPAGYVNGEESAVVHYLERGAALPTFVPPRPYERGLRGRPTLIQNAETLAQVGLIARYGEHWYRELGTSADPGTALITITGAVATPGVYELAFGTSIEHLLGAAGGPSEPLQALLVGGYFGTWVRAQEAMQLRLAREDLRSVGSSLGAGVILALGQSACGLHESARVIDYLASESAGQCGPCVYGLRAIADAFGALADGNANPGEREHVLRWSEEVRGRGACHHPDGAVRFVQSSLSVFGEDLEWHRNSRCTARPAGLPMRRGSRREAVLR